jgi:hypothetical protein
MNQAYIVVSNSGRTGIVSASFQPFQKQAYLILSPFFGAFP